MRLVKAVREVLTEAIAAGGTTIRDFANSDGEPGYFLVGLLRGSEGLIQHFVVFHLQQRGPGLAEVLKGDAQIKGWAEFKAKGMFSGPKYALKRGWGGKFATATKKFEFYSETLKKGLVEHATKFQTTPDDILAVSGYVAKGELAFDAVAASGGFLEHAGGKAKAATGKRERAKQQTLGLEVNTKGRFDKLEPTVYEGEDLDLPTFLRRGIKIA